MGQLFIKGWRYENFPIVPSMPCLKSMLTLCKEQDILIIAFYDRKKTMKNRFILHIYVVTELGVYIE